LCGDYGGGKSATLLEAAIQKAREGFTVFFISAIDTGSKRKEFAGESVFELALEERFRGSGVEVITPRRMREELGRRDEEDVMELIKEFLKKRGDKNMTKV
jgi:hypothetical protein